MKVEGAFTKAAPTIDPIAQQLAFQQMLQSLGKTRVNRKFYEALSLKRVKGKWRVKN